MNLDDLLLVILILICQGILAHELFALENVVLVEVHTEQLVHLLVQHKNVHFLLVSDKDLVDLRELFLIVLLLMRLQLLNSEHLHH